ncbi:hypothetical protein PGB90_007371 [Kerria lacca]
MVRMIGELLNLNYPTVHQVLTNKLIMRKICSKMISKKKKTGGNAALTFWNRLEMLKFFGTCHYWCRELNI